MLNNSTYRNRTELYSEAIRWWMKQSLPVYVVDSAGRGFPSIQGTNLKEFTFDQTNYSTNFKSGSTDGELLSLIKASEHWKTDWELNSYDYIIKVTGKYCTWLVI